MKQATLKQYRFFDTQLGEILFGAESIAALLNAEPTAGDFTTLTASDATILDGALSVGGATTLASTLAVAGTISQASAVSTTDPATQRNIYGKLTANFAGAVTVAGGNGSLVGGRGEFAIGNAATVLGAGYYYGEQGKVTSVAGGTIDAGARVFGTVGQFDLSLATITGNPQISAVWGDMGATAPASGWGTGSSLISGQNTTAEATNSHLYTYGKATYYADIQSNGGAFVSVGAATPSGDMKKLKVNIDGVDLYILAAATWS